MTEEFTADVGPYLAGLEAMIAMADRAAAANAKVLASMKATQAYADSMAAKMAAAAAAQAAAAERAAEAEAHLRDETAAQAAASSGAADALRGQAESAAAAAAGAAAAGDATAGLARDEAAAAAGAAAEKAALDGTAAAALASAAGMKAASGAAAGLAVASAATTTKLAGMLTLGKLFTGGLWTFTSWHYLIDAGIEFGIAIASAALALTAFAAAGARTADAILTHFQALTTVFAATGHAIAPLTTQMQNLSRSMAPDVLQLYGDALDVVRSKTGAFAQMAHTAGAILDNFGARAAIAINRSGAAAEFAARSGYFLNGILQLLANVMGVLGNLFRAAMDTHIAELFITFAQAAAKALQFITAMPTPLLAVVLGLHGIWLWGKLAWATLGTIATRAAGLGVNLLGLGTRFRFLGTGAVDAAGKLGASAAQMAAMSANVGKFSVAAEEGGAKLGFFAEKMGIAAGQTGLLAGAATTLDAIPVWGWAAAAVAGIGLLIYAVSRGKNATDQWISSMQSMVDRSTMVNGFSTLASALGSANAKIAQQAALVHGLTQTTVNLHTGVTQVTSAENQQAETVAKLTAFQQRLVSQMDVATGRLSFLAGRYGGLGQAIGLASLAGVKWNQVLHDSQSQWQAALQQISGMVEGYRMMGQSGSAVANDANAVTFAIEMQDSKVTQLNQAWQTFISTVQSGQTGFVGFEQQMIGLGQAISGNSATLSDSNGTISLSSKLLGGAATAASGTKASFNGLNAASLGMRSTFQQTITSASTLLQNITTMGSAMANGAAGERLVGQASRDVAAQLLTFAKAGGYTRAEIYALFQEAGYHGVNSLKAMSQWSGTAAGAATRLNRAIAQLTIQSSGLAKDVNALGAALGINLNAQMSHAMEAATGFGGKLNTAITDLLNSKVAVGTAQKALHAYWQEQVQVTGSVHGADTAVQLLTQRIMEGKVAAAGAHPDMQQLASELEDIGRKANLSQGQIVTMISQVTHMSRQAVDAALSASNLTHRFGDIGTAAQDAAGRLAGMGNNAAAASAKTDTAITSHLSGLPAKLHAIGQQAVTAIGNAFTAGTGHVAGAAGTMADRAHAKVAAMQGQFRTAGIQAAQGLGNGITAGSSAAVSAAQSLVDQVNHTLSGVHGLNVHSPSKLWHQYGFWAVQGLITGLTDGGPKLMAAVQNMVNSINRAFKAGSLSAAQDSSLVTWVKSDNAKLQALANQRKAIAAQIAAGTATDKALQSSFNSIIGLGHAPAALTAKQQAAIPTAAGMLANLQAELGDIKQFANDLKRLKALGLDNSLIQRIIAMGPITGHAYAQALIAASSPVTGATAPTGKQSGKVLPGGGTSGPVATGIIAQLNSAYSQIQSYSKTASTQITNQMYEAGKQAAGGLLAGLKAQMKAIDAQMRQIADVLVKAIRKALKIKSPSEVMHEHGLLAIEGLARGITAGEPMVDAAMRRVAAIISGSRVYMPPVAALHPAAGGSVNPGGVSRALVPLTPLANPGGAYGGANPGGVAIHVEVHGHVVTEHELLDFIRDGVQTYIHTNGESGLTARRGRG